MGSSFLQAMSTFGGYGYGLPVVFVLGLVVFFHELGHFLVARWCGVRVQVFSIGFGPELAGFNDRRGTRWKLSAFPIGGYVRFLGDDNAASTPDSAALANMTEAERQGSFFFKPVPARAAIVAAGPIANFILAIVIFSAIFILYGKTTTSARVDSIQPDSAAAAAGFQPQDLVVVIDGQPIGDFEEMQRVVAANPDRQLEVIVERKGERVVLKATPRPGKDPLGNRIGILGITHSMAPGEVRRERVGPVTAVKLGVEETWGIVAKSLSFIGGLVAGHGGADQLGGPARIAQISGQVWKLGIESGGFFVAVVSLLNIAAFLSASIGLLNLFPIPLLDGGHLLFYGIEVLRGRPLSDRTQEFGFRIGLALVLMLMIFATYNDYRHWWG